LLLDTHLKCVTPAQQLSPFSSCSIFISGAPPQQDLHTVFQWGGTDICTQECSGQYRPCSI